jgi:hypothetical protein
MQALFTRWKVSEIIRHDKCHMNREWRHFGILGVDVIGIELNHLWTSL